MAIPVSVLPNHPGLRPGRPGKPQVRKTRIGIARALFYYSYFPFWETFFTELGAELDSRSEVRIAGRCTVFAESDMVHKQQLGCATDDIIRGLCNALVRNYFSSVGKGKEIREPVVFQGGVAANVGIRKAFADYLGKEIVIPEHFDVMGAIGAAILAKEHTAKTNGTTRFKGFGVARSDFKATSLVCRDCPNNCEVVAFRQDGRVIAMFGDRCGKYSNRESPDISRLRS